MLSGLKLINFSPCEDMANRLMAKNTGQVFILKTCQRTLLVGFNTTPDNLIKNIETSTLENLESYEGIKAYEFLLETICGLKSRVLGENEIVHQFKEAYTHFIGGPRPNRLVQNLLEKLFKDAKDIRSQHLKNIGLQTYAGITRKLLTNRVKSAQKVVILGSGELAEDLVKIIHRRYDVTLCARNQEKVAKLCSTYKVNSIPWEQLDEALKSKVIINTIGTNETIIDKEKEHIYLSTPLHTLICLAEPSPFDWEKHPQRKNVILLQGVFEFAEHVNREKEHKLSIATQAIREKSLHRYSHFTLNLPFGWDELQFA